MMAGDVCRLCPWLLRHVSCIDEAFIVENGLTLFLSYIKPPSPPPPPFLFNPSKNNFDTQKTRKQNWLRNWNPVLQCSRPQAFVCCTDERVLCTRYRESFPIFQFAVLFFIYSFYWEGGEEREKGREMDGIEALSPRFPYLIWNAQHFQAEMMSSTVWPGTPF